MYRHKHILVAADLIDHDDHPVIERAQEIASAAGAQVSLLHVIEFMYNYGAPWGIENNSEWQEEVFQQAQEKMKAIAEKLNVPKERQFIEVGQAKKIILEKTKELDADLIIVGSHGRHGVGLFLFGSTANSVLQNAKCDVLAVHVGQKPSPEQVALELQEEPAT